MATQALRFELARPRVSERAVIAGAIDEFLSGRSEPSLLVIGAAGMGKTSVLASAFRLLDGAPIVQRIWISGSVIASEGQFWRAVASEANLPPLVHRDPRTAAAPVLRSLGDVLETTDRRLAVFIDDFDVLAFKRESLIQALATEFVTMPKTVIFASAARGAIDRILSPDRPFASRLHPLILSLLSQKDAEELVHIRAPALPSTLVDFVVAQAGGHPAALVFLSRIAELFLRAGDERDTTGMMQRSAELAGSVYAEAWSALGPQQRAILWHVSTAVGATQAVTRLSDLLCLHPSHVSAQLTRLREEGLVVRGDRRGEYTVAPLLARWILERAVRHQERKQASEVNPILPLGGG